ncbi:DUF4166 domain-containing protein [uncultured Erythrobacter sp.]|uniref:DUF4166 domain-containing protein n=1 Tax=uncultured Erythrobacter sp. TaxID=263913 RepID=UPI00261EB8D5|nr:DUF4166 domain-containing protein [uncultured Erythrobacter sp.]
MKPELASIALQEIPLPGGRHAAIGKAYDTRFRRLIGKHAWESLPEAVQRRFSKRVEGARVVIYPGVIKQARFSRAGRILAQLCRLIGGPLPLGSDCGVPAAVSVSEDCAGGGQCWTRVYGRKSGFPQVIHSAKRFAGPTGIEEHIGRGIGMALKVSAVDGGLEFRSDHYFVEALGHRMKLPRWMEPGETVVRHIDQGEGQFVFSLNVRHPWLGELVYQEGLFEDA